MKSDLALIDPRIAEVLANPERRLPVQQSVDLLAEYGTLVPGGGYVLGDKAKKSPMAWAALLMAGASAGDNWQWVVARLLADGTAWEGVRAVNLETGLPAAEDDGYDDAKPNIIPFDYFQVLSYIDEYVARSTQSHWLTVARRFPLDPDHPFYQLNPAWSSAKFTHFQVLSAMDLEIDIVDQLLRRAGRPRAEGGLATSDLIRLREEWRKERDDAADTGTSKLTTVKGETKPKPKVEVVGPIDYRTAKKLHQKGVAKFMIERIPGVDRPQADALAKAILWWTYHEADRAMLQGAAEYEETDPWPLGDEE